MVNASTMLAGLCTVSANAQDIVIPEAPPPPNERKSAWNEFDWGLTTARFGFAMIHEYARYSQDQDGKT